MVLHPLQVPIVVIWLGLVAGVAEVSLMSVTHRETGITLYRGATDAYGGTMYGYASGKQI